MKRPIVLAITAAALLAALVLAGPAAARLADQANTAPPPINARGKALICMDVSFPPMEYYKTTGSTIPVGFDVDVVRSVAGRWGVKTKFLNTEFSGLLPSLTAGKCDFVWSAMFVTADRTAQYPAVPYMRTHRALLVRAGNPENIRKPADLSGKTVATQAGTKFVDALKALDKQLRAQGKPGLKIQTYPKASDATAQLLVGRAAAVLTQDVEAAFRITTQKGKFAIAYLYPAFDTFGAYYRKEDTALGTSLKQTLAALKANGTLAKIARKHGIPESDLI